MNDTIYDFRAHPLLAHQRPFVRAGAPLVRAGGNYDPLVGLIINPRSRHHRGGVRLPQLPNVIAQAPTTRAELRDVLAMFARQQIDLLAIDGGDGTVRDVLTCGVLAWPGRWPDIAVLPAGKTNALAADLGVPSGWTLEAAIAAARAGATAHRAPIEIIRDHGDEPPIRGFLFGAGAFVKATKLAQRTHRAGAFNGVAVGLALSWAIVETLFGRAESAWRRGSDMTLAFDADAQGLHGAIPAGAAPRYIMLASTLENLPARLKPFGAPRPGLKALVVDAPPRRLATALPSLLAGSESVRLERLGYRRVDATTISVETDTSFILDGEIFPAGAYRLRRAAPLRFVVP